MRARTVAALAAIGLVFGISLATVAAGRTDLKSLSGEYGILYYPHGSHPAAGKTFVCAVWFPPLQFSSTVALATKQESTLLIPPYGAMVENLEVRRGCRLDAFSGLLLQAVLATAGIAGGAAVLSRLAQRGRGH